jgi:V8-like Glu-specific endopeptidase
VRTRSPLALLALLAALALIAIPAMVAPVGAAGPSMSRHDRIVSFWTPARLRSAIPRDFVRSNGALVPKKKPGGGGGGGVVGASWTKGGAILKGSGKVYFVMGSSAYVCSGSVATDSRSGKSLVLTAGHCAYDEAARAFATNWLFIPEFDSAPTFTCANTTYGCWTADALVVHNGFASAGSFNTQATVHDFAFAVVGAGGKSGSAQLDATVGSFGISYSGTRAGDKLYAFGYPAAGKYHGNDLTYCAGNIFTDSFNSNLTWGMSCDMTGGSSGGPWLKSFNETTGSGTLNSLNSYGYSGLRNMYGPMFNSNTQAVYSAANAATANTIVH